MQRILIFFFIIIVLPVFGQQNFPVFNKNNLSNPKDWLITKPLEKAAVYRSADSKDIILYNGLLKRSFHISPNVVCTDFTNMGNGQQLLRAVKPEARIKINGKEYNIGGLYGQTENAYLLPEWLKNFKDDANDFHLTTITSGDIKPRLNWQCKTWASNKNQPIGVELVFHYALNQKITKDINVSVHYELYDGIPLMVKWVEITNNGNVCTINRVVNESLALVEEESAVVGSPEQMKKQHGIYVETNYAFNNAMRYDISDQTTHWKTDSVYTSQVNYNYQTPCLLEVYPEKVTGVELNKGETFTSVRTCELLMDSYDRERRGLMIRKMYSTIAPWTTQNPIFMHLVSKNDEEVRAAVDQCAATGYEALILSFGSHCNMEDTSAANIQQWKFLADYAHSKNILIGSYSLFSSRKISDEDDVIDPVTGKPDAAAFFGNAPCMGSKWGLAYLEKLKYFLSNTGFNIFENDGPYPGDVCASTTHPGHKGLDDSQWKQMELQKGLYHWCNEHGIYVNAPDWYFMDGTNKIAIGYREVNFSLPRENQKILNRQNIYDGTWEKTPSMGWGFVPLTKYQGGGAEAVLEPLSEHLKDYEQLMMQYYGAGVQACYRGPRLYDAETTKQTVTSVIAWYKKYRDILNSDIIHLRRADGRDWDGILHVNPHLKTKGLLLLYNPLKEKITRTIKVPLYYTGLNSIADVSEKDKPAKRYQLNRNHTIDLTFTLEAEGFTWFIIE
ncbi:alpha-galactosidase [Panacibacter ginsenosidivorans]|uniref:Alpha-galactosidase n=1 Tax=Panacibacter ginsenosidivorans TaxID=1813871 RepID=A0A5B8VAX1_9BACT|nr:alpha-galactosidase [Panacibacter ginsenosidivorans]QEC68627.1 alpha-galactosidase [Panacibacter ginsenosidivorans]